MEAQHSKNKLIIGSVLFVLGFFSPLLIPNVLASDWSTATKTLISGLLAFGIPEVFILIAIAIMGKKGYEYIKMKVGKYLKPYLPMDQVSQARYNFGLVLFSIPLIAGLLQPYLAFFSSFFKEIPLWFHIGLDVMFVIAIFILGGDFWDKLRGLFQYDVKVKKLNNNNNKS